ncbi:MAG: PTS sugar transporter subunit IIA [Elusimicrobiota bacterium]
MKILDFLSKDLVTVDLKASTKKDVITELVDLLHKSGKIKEKNNVVNILMEREDLGSTGIGQGIAIPHGKSDLVDSIYAAFGVSKKGVNFDALDGEPVHLIFLFIAPPDSAGAHLKALAKISHLLKDKYFRQSLLEAKSSDEVIDIIKEEDEY